MKPQINFYFVIVSFVPLMLGSCAGTEDLTSRQPYVSRLTHTDCLNSRASDDDVNSGGLTTFEMKITGNTAECLFKSLKYSCDFGKVNVEVLYDDGIITVIEYPSSDMADCICEVDATFNIEALPRDSFVLKIYHGDTNGRYNKDYPILSEVVKVKNGSVVFPYGYK